MAGFEQHDLTVGEGRAARPGDVVLVHYTGRLVDGSVFDSSDDATPLGFTIGTGMVIAGFELGIAGMRVGGKRKITVPPTMAVGVDRMWTSHALPTNKVLVFEVELIRFVKPLAHDPGY